MMQIDLSYKMTNDHALLCHTGKQAHTLPIKNVLFDYGRHLDIFANII